MAQDILASGAAARATGPPHRAVPAPRPARGARALRRVLYGVLAGPPRPAFLGLLSAGSLLVLALGVWRLTRLPHGLLRAEVGPPSCWAERGAPQPRKKPIAEYCRCAAGQSGDFSSAEQRARFPSAWEAAVAGRKERPAGPDGKGLRLLMLAMEREQLTKGRLHLAEAMTLARMFNRTFVLTKVSNSRIGYDRTLPMCTYFDTSRIGSYVDWISEDVLLKRSSELQQLRVVPLMLVKPNQECDESLWQRLEPAEGSETHTLTALWRQAATAQKIVCIYERPRRHVQQATDALLKAMSRDPISSAHLVLVFKVGDNMYFPDSHRAWQQAEDHVAFAPHLHSAAQSMEQQFLAAPADRRSQAAEQGYMAVQWRTEYALLQLHNNEKLMQSCVEGLLHAWAALQAHSLRKVFLAADITADGQSASASFQDLPRRQQDSALLAIKKVYKALQPTSWSSVEPWFPLLDNGIQGILDKLVCMHSSVFVYAPRDCGGAASSFTRAIINERHKNRKRFPYFDWAHTS